ncbi:hypothetical protein L228DRAFT_75187 [Xylona heveae TC161]|uniref:Uncharacterized protein n=1 Tax=Xylona heveae (strain CBS 132557 / TC161) TaxID=1328760 RepID=A0A161TGQ3_XYLHT|nr:hypothetical protein L228DRAFT_75187 [Xylona heveae TC161]KZF25367.1 hypothetical protein L228DRAFT_75187 [Xylona heveae TC161]
MSRHFESVYPFLFFSFFLNFFLASIWREMLIIFTFSLHYIFVLLGRHPLSAKDNQITCSVLASYLKSEIRNLKTELLDFLLLSL